MYLEEPRYSPTGDSQRYHAVNPAHFDIDSSSQQAQRRAIRTLRPTIASPPMPFGRQSRGRRCVFGRYAPGEYSDVILCTRIAWERLKDTHEVADQVTGIASRDRLRQR